MAAVSISSISNHFNQQILPLISDVNFVYSPLSISSSKKLQICYQYWLVRALFIIKNFQINCPFFYRNVIITKYNYQNFLTKRLSRHWRIHVYVERQHRRYYQRYF